MLTLVPLKLYTKHGVAKIEIGVDRGRESYDKRDVIRERSMKKEMARALKIKGR